MLMVSRRVRWYDCDKVARNEYQVAVDSDYSLSVV